MTRIHIATMGCPKNMVDSRHLIEGFTPAGFLHVDDPSDARILLINTCGFIKDATEESISEILGLARLKSGGRGKKLVVFGCLAKRCRDELLKEMPEIDAIFGVGEDEKIIEYCRSIRKPEAGSISKSEVRSRKSEGKAKEKESPVNLPGATASFAYLKIAEGCDKKCTFCVIPSIRGRFRSIRHEDILEEAGSFIRAGVKELILVAQDITNYGREWKDYGLISLLRDMSAIKGDFWIRLLYLYPSEITAELLDFVAGEDKICKYLDIPLQHSEDRMLRLMGRRGSRKEYLKLIRTIRRRIPGVTLRTTFITGFPSETEEEFRGMVDFIEEARFERLGVFAYSKEEGTPAASLKGQLPDKVKKRRLDEIMKLQALISLEKNKELIGKRFRALVDEVDDDVILCRLESHAPEIDGVVIIERPEDRKTGKPEKGNYKMISSSPSALPRFRTSALVAGDFVDVEIVDAYDYDLKGVLVAQTVQLN